MTLHFAKRDKGGFGGDAYWHVVRPLHAILYLSASILCFAGSKTSFEIAGAVLGMDAAIGVAAFVKNYA